MNELRAAGIYPETLCNAYEVFMTELKKWKQEQEYLQTIEVLAKDNTVLLAENRILKAEIDNQSCLIANLKRTLADLYE